MQNHIIAATARLSPPLGMWPLYFLFTKLSALLSPKHTTLGAKSVDGIGVAIIPTFCETIGLTMIAIGHIIATDGQHWAGTVGQNCRGGVHPRVCFFPLPSLLVMSFGGILVFFCAPRSRPHGVAACG